MFLVVATVLLKKTSVHDVKPRHILRRRTKLAPVAFALLLSVSILLWGSNSWSPSEAPPCPAWKDVAVAAAHWGLFMVLIMSYHMPG